MNQVTPTAAPIVTVANRPQRSSRSHGDLESLGRLAQHPSATKQHEGRNSNAARAQVGSNYPTFIRNGRRMNFYLATQIGKSFKNKQLVENQLVLHSGECKSCINSTVNYIVVEDSVTAVSDTNYAAVFTQKQYQEAKKLRRPCVNLRYIYACMNAKALLPVKGFAIDTPWNDKYEYGAFDCGDNIDGDDDPGEEESSSTSSPKVPAASSAQEDAMDVDVVADTTKRLIWEPPILTPADLARSLRKPSPPAPTTTTSSSQPSVTLETLTTATITPPPSITVPVQPAPIPTTSTPAFALTTTAVPPPPVPPILSAPPQRTPPSPPLFTTPALPTVNALPKPPISVATTTTSPAASLSPPPAPPSSPECPHITNLIPATQVNQAFVLRPFVHTQQQQQSHHSHSFERQHRPLVTTIIDPLSNNSRYVFQHSPISSLQRAVSNSNPHARHNSVSKIISRVPEYSSLTSTVPLSQILRAKLQKHLLNTIELLKELNLEEQIPGVLELLAPREQQPAAAAATTPQPPAVVAPSTPATTAIPTSSPDQRELQAAVELHMLHSGVVLHQQNQQTRAQQRGRTANTIHRTAKSEGKKRKALPVHPVQYKFC